MRRHRRENHESGAALARAHREPEQELEGAQHQERIESVLRRDGLVLQHEKQQRHMSRFDA